MTSHRPTLPLFASLKPKVPSIHALREACADVPPADPNVAAQDRPRLTGQNARVLERLRQGPLTVTEAWESLGIRRLGARIYDLHQAGYRTLTTRLDNNDTLYTLIEGSKAQ